MTTGVRYETPATVQEAAVLMAQFQATARILAGGTDLLVQMRSGRQNPGVIVNVKHIDEMMTIREESDRFIVGAAMPCMKVINHPGFSRAFPGVVDGANLIGSVQVRGRATMGGNLCNASPAADSVPAVIAAGGIAIVQGPQGSRRVAVEDIPVGPGKTSLAPGELLVAFEFAKLAQRTGTAYLRFTPRTEMDIAVVGAGVRITLDQEGVCTDAKVCLGAVAEKAIVVPEAAQALVGTRVDEAALENLAKAASAAARPITDKRGTKEFRIKLAGVIARRAALKALARAKEQQ